MTIRYFMKVSNRKLQKREGLEEKREVLMTPPNSGEILLYSGEMVAFLKCL